MRPVPLIALSALVLLAIDCDTLRDEARPGLRVTLENQSDHSGVIVTLGDTSIVAVTDSLGWFTLDTLADGSWTVGLSYSYFEKATRTVTLTDGEPDQDLRVELRQQMRFVTRPRDTTLSIARDAHDAGIEFAFSYWQAYGVNLTDSELTVGTTSGQKSWSLIRVDADWPSEFCREYAEPVIMVPSAAPSVRNFAPLDSARIGRSFSIFKDCLNPGTYLLSFLKVDTISHRLFFDPWYSPQGWDLLESLEKSLHRKKDLVGHAMVRIDP